MLPFLRPCGSMKELPQKKLRLSNKLPVSEQGLIGVLYTQRLACCWFVSLAVLASSSLVLANQAASPASINIAEKAKRGNALENDPAALELKEVRNAEKEIFSDRKLRPTATSLPFPSASLQKKYNIPIVYNSWVEDCVTFFKSQRFFSLWLARADRFIPLFQSILRSRNLPTDLVYLSMIESGFSTHAISSMGAGGPWQFMPKTAQHYDLRINFWVDERKDPIKSTHAAARYLKDLYKYWGDWTLAWASYNAGPEKVRKAIKTYKSRDFWTLVNKENAFLQETRTYVPRIMAAALIAKHPQLFSISKIKSLAPFEFEIVEVTYPTDLGLLAQCASVNESELMELNPELLHMVTPPMKKGRYKLRVTKNKSYSIAKCLTKNTTGRYRGYYVRKFDTIRSIAKNFNCNPFDIVRLNQISHKGFYIGQPLVIPITRS